MVRLRLRELRLCRPRQWGACWLALWLWQALRLDEFWAKRLLPSRKGTRWDQVLFVLVAYRLLAPGSEWRLHREWYERSALADLLGADAALCDIHTLYRCHAENYEWVWKYWLACSKLHVLAGPKGTGKSTIGFTLAAVITRGGQWPDRTPCPQGDVLLWSGEDEPAIPCCRACAQATM